MIGYDVISRWEDPENPGRHLHTFVSGPYFSRREARRQKEWARNSSWPDPYVRRRALLRGERVITKP